mmetsp:Transcript_9954/g.25386  ORF Transcript_9954/g.25386 Transcript_9954/m.25386 type:complete len:181 (-) Transcript_9954:77-619(-)
MSSSPSMEGLPPTQSLGSCCHDEGTCKPCAFYHSGACSNQDQCPFCHMCPVGEIKRRKKEKVRKLREEAAAATAAARGRRGAPSGRGAPPGLPTRSGGKGGGKGRLAPGRSNQDQALDMAQLHQRLMGLGGYGGWDYGAYWEAEEYPAVTQGPPGLELPMHPWETESAYLHTAAEPLEIR